ncbi:hypothetical protein WOC76_18020 [Methylocystis sp. IM3]|uniref:hypothetical protein n=1 Tax=unclassified Methylocystis TaxID=2625913 RepID=UPI0030FCAB12
MAFFKAKTIQGVVYDLDHLRPFRFSLAVGGSERVVGVRFGLHCFTEQVKPHHTPDLHYIHGDERRAFSLERHALSKLLPGLIATLGSKTVYLSNSANYFILRDNPMPAFEGPYLVFFRTMKARNTEADVIMRVESSYIKRNMADRASPVKFATLIEKTALGQHVPRGPQQSIKRK